MTFIDEFSDLMHDVVTITPRTGVDRYNKPTFGDPRQVQCMLTQRPKVIRGADGEEKVANTTIHLAEVVGVKVSDRITLPDGSTPGIISVSREPDPDRGGVSFEVVYT